MKFEIGHGTLAQREAIAGLSKLPRKSVDLIVTAVPFKREDVIGRELNSDAAYMRWLEEVVLEMRRVARVVLMLNSPIRLTDIASTIPARRILIWDKMVGMGAYRYEPIFVYADERERLDGPGRIWSDTIRVTPIVGLSQIVPYQNPVRLYYQLLRYFPDFKSVLDPFGGSGTLAIAGELLGRNWTVWEADEDKVRKAAEYVKFELSPHERENWINLLARKEIEEEWTLQRWLAHTKERSGRKNG